MSDSRFDEVKRIFGSALQRKPTERIRYLLEACGDDERLRAEVEELLSCRTAADGLFGAITADAEAFERAASIDLTGSTVRHYEVREKIGEGGMGVVYRAFDIELRRLVALKVLPSQFAFDPERLKRLLREARAASSLNHPNIVCIYEAGSDNGVQFIAMEYVEGKTLRDVIPVNGLPPDKALDYAIQIAAGLGSAHSAGIIHRDLKPGNIMVTSEGLVKILDFGLARRERFEHDQDTTLTVKGQIAGTPEYMSPEQMMGGTVDARSDIFSFGALLYEMATGQRAFPGDSVRAVTHSAPPFLAGAPAGLACIVIRCLQPDPAQRFQQMRDLQGALEDIRQCGGSRRRPWAWIAVPGRVVGRLTSRVGHDVRRLRGGVFWRSGTRRIRSIAVLPLTDLSRDTEHEYFADGMTEELITQLAQIKAWRVTSRTSVMRYKKTTASLREIARELDIEAVVEGSVQRWGDRVRVTAQLVDTSTDRTLWAKSYERDLDDALALQNELVCAIATEMRIGLTPDERGRLSRSRTVDPAAYDAYLQGRAYLNRVTEEGVSLAMPCFEEAIKRDPGFALAYAGLAQSLTFEMQVAGVRKGMEEARNLARKALEIDSGIAEAHVMLAVVKTFYDWDFEGAEREFRLALETNSSSGLACTYYGGLLELLGRPREAIAMAKRAVEIDPLTPYMRPQVGNRYHFARMYDKAISEYRLALSRDANNWVASFGLGNVYVEKGRYEDGIKQLERAVSLSDGAAEPKSSLGHAYARAGRRAEALEILTTTNEFAGPKRLCLFHIAEICVGLGEIDQTFGWLEKAYEERYYRLPWLKVDPHFDSIRQDARFQTLLRRIGL